MLPRGLLKEYSEVLSFILRGIDAFAIIFAGFFAYFYKFGNLNINQLYILALIMGSLVALTVFHFSHLYESTRAKSFWAHIGHLIRAILIVLLIMAGFAFLTKTGELFSRIWFVEWGVVSLSFVLLFRCGLLLLLRFMRAWGWNEKKVIVIGAGKLGKNLVDIMQQSLWTGFHVVAIFDDDPNQYSTTICHINVQKTPKDLGAYLTTLHDDIDEIWIALPLRAEVRVKNILHDLRHKTIAVRFMLDIFGMSLLNHSITNLAGFPALNINMTPMKGMNRLVKAIEDRTLALCILIVVSPLLLCIAIGVKCTSKGSVLFKQKRHGWDGRIINVYKFRTMIEHETTDDVVMQATEQDNRVTSFGRFLRKTSLDELPQFINVLQGRMSIVGPRPHAISHNEYYKDSIKAYMQRHRVKPGITGWAQINGWRGETNTLEKMQKRIEYDLYYIENWSLALDFKIIVLTLFQGFMHKNAY